MSLCLISVLLSTVENLEAKSAHVTFPIFRVCPGEVCLLLLGDRNLRISLSSCRTIRWFLSSVSFVVVALFCNTIPLVICFFLLILVWYSIPPNLSVCFAKGNLLDLLTGVCGSVFFFINNLAGG